CLRRGACVYWVPAFAGTTLCCRHASSPLFFGRPGVSRIPTSLRRLPEKAEGARDAKGPTGPADLDASRHRGWSKSGPPTLLPATAGKPQVRQTQGVPRAVFIDLFRSAPGGLPVSGALAFLAIGGPPIHRCGPKRGGQAVTARHSPPPRGSSDARIGGPGRKRLRPPAVSAHLRCHFIPRPPLPTPHLETLDQTPLGIGWDIGTICYVGNYVKQDRNIYLPATAASGARPAPYATNVPRLRSAAYLTSARKR